MSSCINLLRKKIRHALEPSQPQLVMLWLSMEEQAISHQHQARWDMYISQFELLLESLSDELNPISWRYWCLDNINRPLMSLQRLIRNNQEQQIFRALCYELNVLSQYAFADNVEST